jgi:hypothetical protein
VGDQSALPGVRPGDDGYVGVVGYTVGGGTDRWDGTILTRRWIDPTNRNSDWAQVPLRPGRFYIGAGPG